MFPKLPNKYSNNTVIKCKAHVILGDYFCLTLVSENSILTISKVTQVSKTAGIDNLSGSFLNNGAKFLSTPISDLCNLLITSKKFPDSCELAKPKSLYGKVSSTKPISFISIAFNRPFSLLPLISNVIDKVIHNQTSTFLNSENLIYKRSSDFCLSYLNSKILKGFDKGMMTGMIVIDLQKAFDTIDHDVLLQKLYAIGFSKHIVN